MLTAVIVDDEPKAIQSLNWELSNFDQQIKVVNTFTNPDQALEYLKDNVPDCLFLDIQMPTMDGFQFLQKLDNKNIAVIITTAYNEYAIKALKNDAIDYLLKPIDTDDLSLTVEKIKRFKKTFSADVIEDILINFTNNNSKKKITINTDGKLLFLNVDDILFAESDGNYSTIYMTDKQKILVTKKLKEVNLLLPEHLFFRIHNSYIVNLSKIKEFIKTEG